MANQSIYDAFEKMWEHTKIKLSGKANVSHTHAATDITSETLGVARGGTGVSTFTSGTALIGNGTGAITTRNITNMTTLGYIAYNANLMTTNTLAYWDGSYNLNGSSNLKYCNRGAFGTIVTKNISDYLSSAGGTVTGEITSTNPNGFRITYGGYGTFLRNDGDSFYLLLTNKDNATGTWNNLRPFVVKLSTGHVTIGNGMSVASSLGVNAGLLSVTNNSNTVTIGSANSTWCHFQNSANIPFYFNKAIHSVGGFTVYSTGTSLTNNNLTFAHGGGWSMSDTTWIRAVGNKAVYSAGNFQSDGRFQGGGISSAWNKGRDNAKFRITSLNGYTPGISFKTTNGSWEIGAYNHASYYDGLLFTYISDNYYANTNAPEAQCFLDTLGAFYSSNLLTTEITFLSNSITPNANWSSGSWITDGWIYLCDTNVGIIQMGADNPDKQGVRFGTAGFTPVASGNYLLGHSSYKWKQLVASTTSISTSDRNLKKDFKTFDSDERYEKFFMDLKPMIFKFKDGESNRDHFGFISQDVEDSLLSLGFTGESFAGFCKDLKVEDRPEHRGEENFVPILDENGNEQYEYSLRYSEFISLNTYMIQKTIKENQELKNKINDLESRIQKLEGGEINNGKSINL